MQLSGESGFTGDSKYKGPEVQVYLAWWDTVSKRRGIGYEISELVGNHITYWEFQFSF